MEKKTKIHRNKKTKNIFGECFLRVFSKNENKKKNLHFQDLKIPLVD